MFLQQAENSVLGARAVKDVLRRRPLSCGSCGELQNAAKRQLQQVQMGQRQRPVSTGQVSAC